MLTYQQHIEFEARKFLRKLAYKEIKLKVREAKKHLKNSQRP